MPIITSAITFKGMHLALLPVEPQIGKALVFGCLLGCLEPVLTIAALLSQRNPFLMPMSKKEEADRAKRKIAQVGLHKGFGQHTAKRFPMYSNLVNSMYL